MEKEPDSDCKVNFLPTPRVLQHTHTHLIFSSSSSGQKLDSRQPNDTLSLNSFNKTPSKGGFLLGTTTSSTGDPICEQQQQRVQVYYPSVYYTSGGEQMIRSTAGFLQESDLSSAATAEYGFSCVEPSSNACLITSRKASSGCGGGGGGGTRQHVYDIPHRFKKDPTAVCLMSRSSTVCPLVTCHSLLSLFTRIPPASVRQTTR